MAKITYRKEPFGCFTIYPVNQTSDCELSILVQSDWDYPGTAGTFGWAPCCGATDGTVDCLEHGTTASEMIAEAYDYLIDHQGETADDPGYF